MLARFAFGGTDELQPLLPLKISDRDDVVGVSVDICLLNLLPVEELAPFLVVGSGVLADLCNTRLSAAEGGGSTKADIGGPPSGP